MKLEGILRYVPIVSTGKAFLESHGYADSVNSKVTRVANWTLGWIKSRPDVSITLCQVNASRCDISWQYIPFLGNAVLLAQTVWKKMMGSNAPKQNAPENKDKSPVTPPAQTPPKTEPAKPVLQQNQTESLVDAVAKLQNPLIVGAVHVPKTDPVPQEQNPIVKEGVVVPETNLVQPSQSAAAGPAGDLQKPSIEDEPSAKEDGFEGTKDQEEDLNNVSLPDCPPTPSTASASDNENESIEEAAGDDAEEGAVEGDPSQLKEGEAATDDELDADAIKAILGDSNPGSPAPTEEFSMREDTTVVEEKDIEGAEEEEEIESDLNLQQVLSFMTEEKSAVPPASPTGSPRSSSSSRTPFPTPSAVEGVTSAAPVEEPASPLANLKLNVYSRALETFPVDLIQVFFPKECEVIIKSSNPIPADFSGDSGLVNVVFFKVGTRLRSLNQYVKSGDKRSSVLIIPVITNEAQINDLPGFFKSLNDYSEKPHLVFMDNLVIQIDPETQEITELLEPDTTDKSAAEAIRNALTTYAEVIFSSQKVSQEEIV